MEGFGGLSLGIVSGFLSLFILFALYSPACLTLSIVLTIPLSIPLRTYPANHLPKKHSAPRPRTQWQPKGPGNEGLCPHLLEMAGNIPKVGLRGHTPRTNVPAIVVTRSQPSTLEASLYTSNSGSRPGQRPAQPPTTPQQARPSGK